MITEKDNKVKEITLEETDEDETFLGIFMQDKVISVHDKMD